LIVCVVLALVAAGCSSGDDDDDASGDDDSSEEASGDGQGWTILQYQIGDTNLEPFLMVDVGEMGDVGSNDNLTIRALIDRAADYGDDPVLGLDGWVGGKVVQVNSGSAKVLEDLGDTDTGDPDVLQRFITKGIEENPAAHYAVVLSDHGSSWPGVGGDEGSQGDGLTVQEIHDAVAGALEDTGVDKLDLLGFDACLMATYEVATNMAPLADRMVASSELEPGHGWDYHAYQAVADDPNATADDLGTAIVDGFRAQAQAEGTEANVTLALLDLTQMDIVDQAVADFTAALEDLEADVAPAIGRVRPDSYSYGRSPDPTQDTFMTDLGDLAARIGIEALDVSDEADALQQAINDAVVDKVSGPESEAFTGMSVYFPPQDWFSPDYESISTEGDWMGFLQSFYGAGDALPEDEQAELTNPDDTAEVSFDEDGLTITGTFDPAIYENLSDAYISYGIVDENGVITYFGDESATLNEDGTAEGFFDLTQLTITDGQDTAVGYLSLVSDEDEEGFTVDVPMSYYAPDDPDTAHDILLELVVDADGNVTQETYFEYDEELGTYGELTADPEGIIVPELVQVDADGNEEWVPTTDVGLYADIPELLYDLVALDSGTQLYVELVVEDFAGNTSSVSATVTVP
jgi:hypothetical protein